MNDETGRPQVLLIGDSIRMGYCAFVKEELSGCAEVLYPKENCRNTQHVLISLNAWTALCTPEKTAAVQFNCGHWDAAHWDGDAEPLTSLGEYGRNTERIIARLRACFPNAKLIAATTTPMNPSGGACANPRTTDEIRRYNEALVTAAEKNGVYVNDLFGIAGGWDGSRYLDYCHFQEPAYAELGKATAEFIRTIIKD